MAVRSRDIFTTIHTEGAILPPDLLQHIAEGSDGLDGLRAEDYHRPIEKLNEVINHAWNVLLAAWANFQNARESLPEGDLGTTITRERWLLPLFRELDYGRLPTKRAAEIGGKTYPISHRDAEGNVPIHLLGCNVDLDKRTPGVAGAATTSPHSMLQVFLNRSDDHLWGFLSNGLRLRILRDNVSLTRQAYVEFDLEAMMNGEVYADFVLLWLLCHQSRVEGERPEQFWLERWMQTAVEQGTRALDQLRDNVQVAIERLGEGFLAHPHNMDLRDKLQDGRLDRQDYYRQLLRLVYRLLFLFVAEDRGLLLDPATDDEAQARYTDYYSTRRLRDLAERLRGTRHHDLFHGLRLVMRLLGAERNGEGRALGLPVLGSFLFSDEAVADLIDCEISNCDLLEAIRALAFTEDRAVRRLRPVDYKNLGPEELGSVYESLLELHPEVNVVARSFTLGTASGHERKTTGSYYTPASLIQALLDSALDPVLEEALTPGPSPRGRGEKDREAAILDLKICDPACGSGHFLIAAAHRLAKALASVRTQEDEPAPDAVRTALRDVIGHCIYGVDINPMAVELCKVGLWMEALEPGKPLSFLDHRIRCGNSLLGTTPALMARGIPVDAFPTKSGLLEGDENKVVSRLRKRNREERKARETGQRSMFELIEPPADYGVLAAEVDALDAIQDHTLDGVRAKEQRYRALAEDPEYIAAQFLADAWCAAFVWRKAEAATYALTPGPSPSGRGEQRPVPPPITDLTYRLMEEDPHDPRWRDVRAYVAYLRERYQFFHWHVAFPDVFSRPHPESPPQGDGPHPKSLSQGERDLLRRGTKDAERYERIASKAMVQISRDLRQRQTPAEAIMWEALRNRRLNGLKFRRQHPIAETHYVVDFLCYEAGLVVEIDGDIHDQQQQADAQRQRHIESLGYTVMRFTNDQVYNDLQWVLATIAHAASLLPSPPGRRAGDEGLPPGRRGRPVVGGNESYNEHTGWSGGFDVVLGNPPWDQIQLDDREFFATSAPDIAQAPHMSARKRMIRALRDSDPVLYRAYHQATRQLGGVKSFIHASGLFPLTSFGRLNSAPLFAELALQLQSPTGRVGQIVPTGIATDSFNQYFFQDLISSLALVSLYDFENRDAIFPGVHRSYKFCLLTLAGPARPARGGAEFVFFAHAVPDLLDPERRFTLAAEDIALINPNTGTTATFRSRRDADLTKAIYRRMPVLVDENDPEGGNPWGITFKLMFMMNTDSHLFRTREELEAAGWRLEGNRFVRGEALTLNPSPRGRGTSSAPPGSPLPGGEGPGVRAYLPLYEAKMMHQFDHRWATYEPNGDTRDLTDAEKRDPARVALPRYWVDAREVLQRVPEWDYDWFISYRDIARATDERTGICSVIPYSGTGCHLMLFSHPREILVTGLVANLNRFVFDFIVRQKVGGTHLNFFYVKQFPALPPAAYTPPLLDFIVPRVLELTYTAWDLQPFAQDVGWDGPPFVWNEERRFLLRCELDALYFHLYGITRDDVDYIMETFPIVKRKDIAATQRPSSQTRLATAPLLPGGEGLSAREESPPRPEGEGDLGGEGYYRTKRVILAIYDEMAAVGVPDDPDRIAAYETWLSPPPADPSVAHPPR